MKHFFHRDTIFVGFVVGLGSELIIALLLYAGLLIADINPADHVRWFGGIFIAPVLFLRFYAKSRRYQTVTKTIITILFISFLLFMFYLFKTKAITL